MSRSSEGSLDTIRAARKPHPCDGYRHHGAGIQTGDRYRRLALPPGSSDHGNTGWWTLRICSTCHPIAED